MDHWNINVQRQYGSSPRDRGRLRRLARPRSDHRPGHQPGGRQPLPVNLRPNPQFADITSIESRGDVPVQRAAGQVSAARRTRPVAAAGLHARQVHRRCVGVLHERGRSELPAEQPRPRRRARPFQLRRPAPVLGGVCLRPAVRDGQRAGCATSKCRGSSRCRAAGRSPSRCCPISTTATPDDRTSGFGNNDRPNVTGDTRLDDPTADAVVRHLGVLAARLRHLRQRGPQHPDRPELQERQPGAGQAVPRRRVAPPAAPRSRRSTCSTGSTTICPTRSSARPPSARSCRRGARGGFSWGSGRSSDAVGAGGWARDPGSGIPGSGWKLGAGTATIIPRAKATDLALGARRSDEVGGRRRLTPSTSGKLEAAAGSWRHQPSAPNRKEMLVPPDVDAAVGDRG